MLLRPIILLACILLSTSVNAGYAKTISEADLRSLLQKNPVLAFAGSGQELEVDEQYSVAAFAQSPKNEGGHLDFYKGRRYALVTLDRITRRVVVVLEAGELERGHEPVPELATRTCAEFSFIDMYTEYRRVRFTFEAPNDKAFFKSELPAGGTADVL